MKTTDQISRSGVLVYNNYNMPYVCASHFFKLKPRATSRCSNFCYHYLSSMPLSLCLYKLDSFTGFLTSGPVVIMVLEKENAVADWRALIGPTDANKAKETHPRRLENFATCHLYTTLMNLRIFFLSILSIRALCGLSTQRNCVHGSDSPQSAARERSFFFEKSSSGQHHFVAFFNLQSSLCE